MVKNAESRPEGPSQDSAFSLEKTANLFRLAGKVLSHPRTARAGQAVGSAVSGAIAGEGADRAATLLTGKRKSYRR